MALTGNCSVFASFHEEGFNRIIDHVRAQRPSLFNYATKDVAENRELWCAAVDPHPIIGLRNNPLFTIVDPLPIPGTMFGVNFIAQIPELVVDFHPSDEFPLPPELSPLDRQKLAIKLKICGGIACPGNDAVEKFKGQKPKELTPLPAEKMLCFCLDGFGTGGVRIVEVKGKKYLEPYVDGIEIVDLRPEGLENSIECYITLILKLSVLPGLRVLLQSFIFNLTERQTEFFPQPINVKIGPTPVSAAVPFNPAIEDDQLKAFIDVEVI